VPAELQAVAVEAAVFLFRALFEATSDDGVTLGIAEQMGKADAGGGFVVVGFAE
jgi:hypothetical protein